MSRLCGAKGVRTQWKNKTKPEIVRVRREREVRELHAAQHVERLASQRRRQLHPAQRGVEQRDRRRVGTKQ